MTNTIHTKLSLNQHIYKTTCVIDIRQECTTMAQPPNMHSYGLVSSHTNWILEREKDRKPAEHALGECLRLDRHRDVIVKHAGKRSLETMECAGMGAAELNGLKPNNKTSCDDHLKKYVAALPGVRRMRFSSRMHEGEHALSVGENITTMELDNEWRLQTDFVGHVPSSHPQQRRAHRREIGGVAPWNHHTLRLQEPLHTIQALRTQLIASE